MGELDLLIEKYINNINLLMRHRTSNKVLFNLKSELSSLFMAMDLSDTTIKLSDRVLFNLEKGNDDIIDDRIKDKFVESFYDVYDSNCKFASIGSDLISLFGEGYVLNYQKNLSIEDVINISRDFFDYYDVKYKDFFVKKVDEGKVFFVDTSTKYYDGMTFPLPSQNDSFIISGYDSTINSCLTLVHEMIHSYVDYYKNENFEEIVTSFINNTGEIYSKFIEYVFMNYLHEVKFFDRDIKALEVNGDVNLLCFIKDFNNNLLLDPEEVYYDDASFYNYMDVEKYTLGHLIGFNYYMDYLKNENKTKDNIFEFSISDGKNDRDYLFNNYGLNDKKNYSSKKLVKEMKRHFNY